MGAQGHGTINFGAFPGKTEAFTTAVMTGVSATSEVETWVRMVDSTDHSADEHAIEDLVVIPMGWDASAIVTVWMRPQLGRCYGEYNFSWVWNG